MSRAPPENDERSAFERSYCAALAKYVRATDGAASASAADPGGRIGRRAVRVGVGTLELARIHDRAVAARTPAAGTQPAATIERTDSFFASAVTPVEASHSDAISDAEYARLAALLRRRTSDLATARARLSRESARGQAGREKLDASARDYGALLARSRLMERRLRHLSHELISAQEEERKRISRDLHDAIGQTLTGINVGLAGLKTNAARDSRGLAKAISLTQQLVERSMKTVHQFAWELRPTLLDDLGLVPALRSYVKTFKERTGLSVRFTCDAKSFSLSSDGKTALFRIAQGALSNVERHAGAESVRVSLMSLPGVVRLEVTDDGRSFDVERVESATTNTHLGLLVLRERAEMVDGSLCIESVRGQGTTVRADVPVGAKPRD